MRFNGKAIERRPHMANACANPKSFPKMALKAEVSTPNVTIRHETALNLPFSLPQFTLVPFAFTAFAHLHQPIEHLPINKADISKSKLPQLRP